MREVNTKSGRDWKPNTHVRLRSEVGFEPGSTQVKGKERNHLITWALKVEIGALDCLALILKIKSYIGPGRFSFTLHRSCCLHTLQVFKQFQHITGDLLSLHLVEVSPKMSQLQEEKLTGRPGSRDASSKVEDSTEEKAYKSVQSKTGVPVSWYRRLQDVPKGRKPK